MRMWANFMRIALCIMEEKWCERETIQRPRRIW
nr:MAG TPA: hypothetical protein [Caudoviricetes sp.]